jgi:dihydroorotase
MACDLVIFDIYEKWIVDFRSKSSNSPFLGRELYGKVKYTLCRGKVVYEDK